MLWEPFRLERRRLPGRERGWPSGEGLDYCAVRERDFYVVDHIGLKRDRRVGLNETDMDEV